MSDTERKWTQEEIDEQMFDDGECFHCGGEGFVSDCLDGCCEDAESGCDDCTRPCPECSPKVRHPNDELGQVLADALKQTQK